MPSNNIVCCREFVHEAGSVKATDESLPYFKKLLPPSLHDQSAAINAEANQSITNRLLLAEGSDDG